MCSGHDGELSEHGRGLPRGLTMTLRAVSSSTSALGGVWLHLTPTQQRLALLLFLGLSQEEIADREILTVGAVSMQVTRLRQRARQIALGIF